VFIFKVACGICGAAGLCFDAMTAAMCLMGMITDDFTRECIDLLYKDSDLYPADVP
jgi:hypothetical protein